VPRLDVQRALNLVLKPEGGLAVAMEIRALYDAEFAKDLRLARRDARKAERLKYTPTKCISPECDHQVAPPGIKPRAGHFKNYSNIGACCKAHTGYICLHPTCQAKA